MAELLPKKGSKLIYTYDMGDDWHHEIQVEKVSAPVSGKYGSTGSAVKQVRSIQIKPTLSQSAFRRVRDALLDRKAERVSGNLQESDEEASFESLQVIEDICVHGGQMVLLDHLTRGKQPKPTHSAFTFIKPRSGWKAMVQASGRRALILDATAGVDPTYLACCDTRLEKYPPNDVSRGKVVILNSRSKTAINQQLQEASASAVAMNLVQPLLPWKQVIEFGLLVLGSKGQLIKSDGSDTSLASELRKALAPLSTNIGFGTFGGLRGRNDLANYDAVYFIAPHRYDPGWYLSLDLLVSSEPVVTLKAQSFNTVDPRIRNGPIANRALAADIVQDAMRIALRSKEKMHQKKRMAHIFLPIDGMAGVTVRIASMLAGCTVVVDGEEIVIPSTQTAQASGSHGPGRNEGSKAPSATLPSPSSPFDLLRKEQWESALRLIAMGSCASKVYSASWVDQWFEERLIGMDHTEKYGTSCRSCG